MNRGSGRRDTRQRGRSATGYLNVGPAQQAIRGRGYGRGRGQGGTHFRQRVQSIPRISGGHVTAVPVGAQDQGRETQAQMTQGESQPDYDQAKAAHAPDTEDDTSSDDGAIGAGGPAVVRTVPNSPLQWRRVKLTDQPAWVQAEFLPEYSPHHVDRLQDATPLEIFTNSWTDNFLEFICEETKRLAQQKGNHRFTSDMKALI